MIFSFSIFQGGPGSVRFGYGLGMERFNRFRFSVPAVPLQKEFLCISVQFNRERTVPLPVSVPGKRFRRFRFRFQFREKRFCRCRFPVPVRFLSHPDFLGGPAHGACDGMASRGTSKSKPIAPAFQLRCQVHTHTDTHTHMACERSDPFYSLASSEVTSMNQPRKEAKQKP